MLNSRRAKMLVSVLVAAVAAFASPGKLAASMLAEAQKFSGLHEVKNNRKLRAILGVNPARIPWCGYFMGVIVRKTGSEPPRDYSFARAWTKFGYSVSINRAQPGDIVVIRSRIGYHVGLLSDVSKKSVHLIGGNQSNGVQQSQYSRSSVVAVRRNTVAARATPVSLPSRTLERR